MIRPLIRANRFPALRKCQNICGLIAFPPFASTGISVDFKRTQGESTCDRPRGGENAYTASIMDKLDFTFIHAPATYDFRERSIMYGPVSDMVPSTPIFEMYPLGLTTLCEYFERNGFRARIYNLASMMLHKKNFDVEKNLARLESRMFGIDLHWMPHCHGSIEVAKILKRLHPHVPISFGGLSSSIFHEDLIAYDCIDYVFRGDSTEEDRKSVV